jgi:hypothetical protein
MINECIKKGDPQTGFFLRLDHSRRGIGLNGLLAGYPLQFFSILRRPVG